MNTAEQRKKLVQVLSVAIAGLDNLEGLVPVVETLAASMPAMA